MWNVRLILKITCNFSSLLSLWKFVLLVYSLSIVFSHTWNTQKSKRSFQFQKQPSPSEKTCLPVLFKSPCSHIMLCQKKPDLAFTPIDPFIHQLYPLTQQAKKSCRLCRDVGGEKEFVLLCCTRQNLLFYGAWWHMYSLHYFFLSNFYVLKKVFSQLQFPCLHIQNSG